MNNLVFLNYAIILNIFNFYFVNNEIIFVYEHSRHGVRSPVFDIHPKFDNITEYYDDYKTLWDGDGILTLKGKMQHYILGIRNRYKYPNLLNYTKFNPKELLIHVTYITRVQESAYNQLLGMYNPIINISNYEDHKNEISDKNELYYPPNYKTWKYNNSKIHQEIIREAELSIELLKELNTKTFLTEGLFNLKESNKKNNMNINFVQYSKNRTFYVETDCSNYREYIHHYYKKDFFKFVKDTLENKYGERLREYFGYDKNEEWLKTIGDIFSLFDVFMANYYDGKDLEKFYESTGIDKEEYFNICFNIYKWWLIHLYCDEELCVMESSKMMEDLIKYMDNKINNITDNLKMVIDLGHDVTVTPMQIFMHEAFNVDYTVCDFGCNIYFELHKEEYIDKHKYYIEYYVDEQLRLKINYDSFKANVISTIWSEKDKDKFCRGNIMRLLYPKVYLFLFTFLIMIFVGCFVLIIYKCYILYFKKYKKSISKEVENKLLDKNRNRNINNSKRIKLNNNDVEDVELEEMQ